MSRFEDSPELFGNGSGISTCGNIQCEWCKTSYTNRENAERDTNFDNDIIAFTTFAGLQVCDCCFERIETEILERIEDIIQWFTRIIANRKKLVQNHEDLLNKLRRHLVPH